MQIIDDGRLTDGKGNTADFKDTFIIFTSNAGTEELKQKIGFGQSDKKPSALSKEEIHDIMKKHFKPEFINRLDTVLYFKELDETALLAITELKLEQTAKVLKEKGLEIHYSEAVVQKILKEAEKQEEEYVMRNIPRVIQTLVLEPLADMKLSAPNLEEVTISVKGNRLCFTSVK